MIADIVTKGFPNPKVQKHRSEEKPYDDCRIESTCYIHQFMKEGSHSNMKFLNKDLPKRVI